MSVCKVFDYPNIILKLISEKQKTGLPGTGLKGSAAMVFD